MLESWFETVQKQPKGEVLERFKKGIHKASPKSLCSSEDSAD